MWQYLSFYLDVLKVAIYFINGALLILKWKPLYVKMRLTIAKRLLAVTVFLNMIISGKNFITWKYVKESYYRVVFKISIAYCECISNPHELHYFKMTIEIYVNKIKSCTYFSFLCTNMTILISIIHTFVRMCYIHVHIYLDSFVNIKDVGYCQVTIENKKSVVFSWGLKMLLKMYEKSDVQMISVQSLYLDEFTEIFYLTL